MRVTILPPHAEEPPQPERTREDIRIFADFLATLLDSCIHIPGTNIRIGLDPLLGLIPGIGDLLSNLLGTTILFLATQLGVPRIVIFRMALNVFLNTFLGAIPGFGDLFSVWFKSNVRNAALLRRYCRPVPPRSTIGDWIYVSVLILVMFLATVGALFLILWLIAALWQFMTSPS
ncbi:MAG: DUF4112 domain-containing protein [Nitrospirae bacterium]|nr:MAG: DUF4112 domain-containing protein [Nitrospirota bacterium]